MSAMWHSRGGRGMKITLNGKETEIAQSTTLSKLLGDLKITPQMVACEINSKIIRRTEYPRTRISEGDQIEILQMIGGG